MGLGGNQVYQFEEKFLFDTPTMMKVSDYSLKPLKIA